MTDKTFSHIGVASYKGRMKFKWTMGKVEARIKILQKSGFENIEFQALPTVMTKPEALGTTMARDLATRYGLKLTVKDLATSSVTEDAEAAEAA